MEQFGWIEKVRWAKRYIKAKDKIKIRDEFINENLQRYTTNNLINREHRRNAHQRLKIWASKYNLGMKELKSKTGQKSGGRPKKTRLSELDNSDIDTYQEIIDELIKDGYIDKSELNKRIRERKNKIKNKSKFSNAFSVNRKIFDRKPTGRRYKIISSDLIKKINNIWIESFRIYGYKKIYEQLSKADNGISLWDVRKHYEFIGLSSIKRNKFKNKPKEAKSTNIKGTNLIGKEYIASKPNEKWFTDVSYIKLKSGRWIYLSAVIDSYSNKVIHWELSFSNDKYLATNTLANAIKKYGVPKIVHTDHGTPYFTKIFQNICNKLKIKHSLSGVGISLDNRPIEFWFGLLKHEYLLHHELRNIEETEFHLNKYSTWYNEKRIQSNLKNMSPDEYLHSYCN